MNQVRFIPMTVQEYTALFGPCENWCWYIPGAIICRVIFPWAQESYLSRRSARFVRRNTLMGVCMVSSQGAEMNSYDSMVLVKLFIENHSRL